MQMERPILFTGDTYARSVHRCFRQRIGDYCEQQNYKWDMDSGGIGATHQLPETTCDMEVRGDEAITGSSTSHLLRQQVSNRLCPTRWRNAIPTTDDPGIKNLGDMSDNEYSTSSHLHTFSNQLSRFPFTTTNHSNRMDDRSKILSTTRTFSIPVPTMESTTSMSPTPSSISNIGESDHTALAEHSLVSSAPLHEQPITATSSTNNDSPQSTGRRSIQKESAMATASMEYKRQRLEHHGTNFYDVNYLAYGHHTLHWQVGTCPNYKSAILTLYDQQDRGRILSDHHFEKFFTNLRALTVRSFDKPNYDLTSVITKLHHWGSNDNITVEQLTRKLCFLLAITGFLRRSGLHRVNLEKASVTANGSQLKLLIDCLKEKPLVFQSYLTRVANTPCFGPLPTRPSRTINFIIRKLNDYSAPVSVHTISRHVRSLLSLIAVADDSGVRRPPLRARAVGSTITALLGANEEDILVLGSWASSCVFDNFYRLSRQTVTNFTTVALSSNSLAVNTLTVPPSLPLFYYYFILYLISEIAIFSIDNCIHT
ncbi:hypothetical protein G6F43_010782 [Rhizopus delemar]|nr:hypothetical protein G6F43_010782 [Rhizopus delemar]